MFLFIFNGKSKDGGFVNILNKNYYYLMRTALKYATHLWKST